MTDSECNHEAWSPNCVITCTGTDVLLAVCCCAAIRDMLPRAYYLSRVDNVRKIRDRKQRTDIGKYSFVNRNIKNWNQLPAEALRTFPCKPKIFRELGKQLYAG